MAVRIGSARINEKGTTTGGKAGDQTGGEVSIQNYYLHRKGWYVARPKDPTVAEKIVQAMEAACNNNYIGIARHTETALERLRLSITIISARSMLMWRQIALHWSEYVAYMPEYKLEILTQRQSWKPCERQERSKS